MLAKSLKELNLNIVEVRKSISFFNVLFVHLKLFFFCSFEIIFLLSSTDDNQRAESSKELNLKACKCASCACK